MEFLSSLWRGKHFFNTAAVCAAAGRTAFLSAHGTHAALPVTAPHAPQHTLHHRAMGALSAVAVAGKGGRGRDGESNDKSKRLHSVLSVNDVETL